MHTHDAYNAYIFIETYGSSSIQVFDIFFPVEHFFNLYHSEIDGRYK